MASNKLKNVRKERGPKNLSSNIITSTDIYKIQPIWCRETKEKDIWNIEHEQTNICDALSVPSFIKVKSRNTMFFTPYAKVWQPFESVMGGTSINLDGYTYKLKQMPVLDPLFVLAVMAKNHYVHRVDYTGEGIIVEDGPYDFRLKKSGADEYIKLKFTSVGRRIWNSLQGLGYKLSMFHEYTVTGAVSPLTFAEISALIPYLFDFATNVKVLTNITTNNFDGRLYYKSGDEWVSLPKNDSTVIDSVSSLEFQYVLNGAYYYFTLTPSESSTDLEEGQLVSSTVSDSNPTIEILPQQLAPSALKLMAYAKIYAENFVPGKYGDICNEVVSAMYNLAEYLQPTKVTFTNFGLYPESTTVTGVSSDGVELLEKIFSLISSVYYGDDYFTSSPTQAMTSPDGLNESPLFEDLTTTNTGFLEPGMSTAIDQDTHDNYTPVHVGRENIAGVTSWAETPYRVSEYIHNMLHLVTKNIQLKALAGSKLAQRLYALYGGKSEIESNEAVALGQNVSDIEVRSITSFADTGENGAELGQKGGQMNNWNQRKFHVETQKKGCLIYVNQIIPIYFYGQGLHREMMHVKPNDFYNDQFALAGYQNIGRFELFNDDQMGYYLKRSLSPKGSWGKTSAYAELALRMDNIFGDFALLSRMNLLDAFHFNRFIVDQQKDMEEDKKVSELGLLPLNNEDFMKVFDNSVGFTDDPSVNHQFDRIFTDSNSNDDHIAQDNKFFISVVRDGRNINDFTIGESDGHEVELQGLGKVLYG